LLQLILRLLKISHVFVGRFKEFEEELTFLKINGFTNAKIGEIK